MKADHNASKRAVLLAKMADADARGSNCLAEANAASEAGKKARAERLYERGQFWLDRSNAFREKLWQL